MNNYSNREHISRKNNKIKQDILFIQICINNINLLEVYYYKKYKSEFWKKVCFEYNKYSDTSAKTCKQLRDKFKYIYKNYLTIWRVHFSNRADLNVLEINFKEVLDICFTHIGYDEAGTLSLRKYIPNPSRVIKERTPCNNVSSYQQGKHNTIVPDSLMRGSVSLSSLYGDTSIDNNVEELQVKKEDVFDSYPVSHSYYNYTRQVKEPFDSEVLKSVKFIEELKSNSYTLSDLDNFSKDWWI